MPTEAEATRFDRVFAGTLAGLLLVAGFFLGGLSKPLDFTGSWDELTYHYPSALYLANHTFPGSLATYPSATGPVAYLLAQVCRTVDMSLVGIRWLTVLVTFFLGLILYRLFVDRFELERLPAAAFTMLALLSPYALGGTFVFMTDNYAWLFVGAWAYWLSGYGKIKSFRDFLWSALFLGLALCTRQTTAWMVPITAYAAWSHREHRARDLAVLVVACIPLTLLVLLWHGPTPPSALGRHTGIEGSYLRAATMALTTMGAFACFLVPSSKLKQFAAGRVGTITIALSLFGGGLLLMFAPLAGDLPGVMRNPVHVDGYLLKLLDHGPKIGDSFILYLPFLCLGILTTIIGFREARQPVVIAFLLCLVVHLGNKIVYERYFEVLILVTLSALFGTSWREIRIRVALLGFLFFAHPFLRHRLSPTPFEGIDLGIYPAERAQQLAESFIPKKGVPGTKGPVAL